MKPLQARLEIESYYVFSNLIDKITYDNLELKEIDDVYPEIKNPYEKVISGYSIFLNYGLTQKIVNPSIFTRRDLLDIRSDLKYGYSFNFGATLYNNNGLGVTYQHFYNSSSAILNPSDPIHGTRHEAFYKVERTIQYLGLNYYRRVFLRKQDELVAHGGLGYYLLQNFNGDRERDARFESSASSIGLSFGLSYDLYIANNLFFSVF